MRCVEDDSEIGGTWFGIATRAYRFDSEVRPTGTCSKELQKEWNWEKHYSGQPENEQYLNVMADKFDLKRNIQFNSHVTSAIYDDCAESLGDPDSKRSASARAVSNRRSRDSFGPLRNLPSKGFDSLQGQPVPPLAMAERKSEIYGQVGRGYRHRSRPPSS